ncbi:MAG: hypothetical protein HYV97_14085 [Bdellovibrio sp.]|nr:hypothetical protein [Bdellovibrio sp.]
MPNPKEAPTAQNLESLRLGVNQKQDTLACKQEAANQCCPSSFDWTGTIDSFSHFAWPIVVLILFAALRGKLAKLIDRIRSVSAGKDGVQIGLVELAAAVSVLPPEEPIVRSEDSPPKESKLEKRAEFLRTLKKESVRDVNTAIANVIEAAKGSPKLGLITLAIELEQELKILIASMGLLSQVGGLSLKVMLEKLAERGALAPSITTSIKYLVDARNTAVHGGEIEPAQINSIIDMGITILRAVYSIPCEKHEVFETNIDLFSDKDLKSPVSLGKGLILKSTTASGVGFRIAIYPTTRTHFVKGRQVAWEWSFGNKWAKTWYYDKELKGPKVAWDSSAEFIGRHIQDL